MRSRWPALDTPDVLEYLVVKLAGADRCRDRSIQRFPHIGRAQSLRATCGRHSCGELLQQRLRLLQIARVEPFSEPAVDRSQQFASLLHLALVAPEAREAHGGAEFQGFGLLLAGDGESALEIGFCLRCIRLGRLQRDLPGNAINFGLEPSFLRWSKNFKCIFEIIV